MIMENEVKNSHRSGYPKGLGFGLILMFIGVVILGSNFGLIPIPLRSTIISWQMLLIFIGVVNLFKRKLSSGLILIFIGGFFLFPKVFPALSNNYEQNFWPLILIVAGIIIVLHRAFAPKYSTDFWNSDWHKHHRHHHHDYSKWYSNESNFSKNSVFGSGEHIVLDPEFKGGDMNAVFGGITLDLRRTSLPVGETVLEVNAVFGGITIFVPNDWYIETHLDAVFGGFKDDRNPKEPIDKTRKLIITGSCIFGGGELRN